jgi:hypothetical protein
MRKEDLSRFKGKKITFKQDNSFPDIKVKFVDSFPDYKIKVASDRSFATSDVIKYKEDSSFPDVKLQRVTSFEDFQIWFE